VENLDDFQATYDQLVETQKKLVLFTVKSGALTRFVLLKQTPDTEDRGEQADD
jgi:hypothetical protein